MEAQIWMAHSKLCARQNCFGVVRKRWLETQKKNVSEGRGQVRYRDSCDDECKTLGRTQSQDWRMCQKQTNKTVQDIGTARRVDFHPHREYHGANVWRQQCGRKLEPWTLRDGRAISRTNWTGFRKHCVCGGRNITYPMNQIDEFVRHQPKRGSPGKSGDRAEENEN